MVLKSAVMMVSEICSEEGAREMTLVSTVRMMREFILKKTMHNREALNIYWLVMSLLLLRIFFCFSLFLDQGG
jgi:hypothetical protein